MRRLSFSNSRPGAGAQTLVKSQDAASLQLDFLRRALRHRTGWLIAVAILVIVLVPVLAIIGYLAWKEKRRTKSLKEVAEKLFRLHPQGRLQQFLDGFPLHARGYGKKLSGLMRGRSASFDVALFDYRYTIGGGKTSQTRQQSVVWFQSSGLDLPDFSLAPRSFWHTVRRWFGQAKLPLKPIRCSRKGTSCWGAMKRPSDRYSMGDCWNSLSNTPAGAWKPPTIACCSTSRQSVSAGGIPDAVRDRANRAFAHSCDGVTVGTSVIVANENHGENNANERP